MKGRIPHTEFLDNYAECIVVATYHDRKIIYCNATFERVLGLTIADIEGMGVRDLFVAMVNHSLFDTKTHPFYESSVRLKNGDYTWVRVSETTVGAEVDEQFIVFTLVDNSALNQVAALLRESENRFSNLADASPVLIWMTDHENQCYYFNKAWFKFTGKSYEDEVGTGWLKNVHPDDIKQMGAISSQLQNLEEYSIEYRLKRHDGEYRNLFEIGTPRFLPDGRFAGYIGSCMDITELKKIQNELATQTQELKRSNEDLEQFAYVASHDLQEPLRMISSYIQLIDKQLQKNDNAEVKQFMQFVVDAVLRMQALINDMLQYSRLNKRTNTFTISGAAQLVDDAIKNLESAIKQKGASIHVSTPLPDIACDKTQIIRVFQNLIENALKFSSTEKPIIRISYKSFPGHHEFCVEDNGIGIDPKFHAKIFVIFQRLHTRSDYEGTGIGLSICKKIVERHGGEVRVESQQGEGSNFYFTISKQLINNTQTLL